MRGEHSPQQAAHPYELGSSPHARGTLIYHDKKGFMLGIIPACAGNTIRFQHSPADARDHPRMRGEHSETSARKLLRQGSSPHARGTLNVITQ